MKGVSVDVIITSDGIHTFDNHSYRRIWRDGYGISGLSSNHSSLSDFYSHNNILVAITIVVGITRRQLLAHCNKTLKPASPDTSVSRTRLKREAMQSLPEAGPRRSLKSAKILR